MTITATYKDGAFVPESPVSLPEGARVQVIMPEEEARLRGEETRAALMARFPNSIGTFTHEEAEEMRQAIEEACEQVDDERDCLRQFSKEPFPP